MAGLFFCVLLAVFLSYPARGLKVGPSTTKTTFEFQGNDWLVGGLTGLYANVVNSKLSTAAVADLQETPNSSPLSPAQLRDGILGDFEAGYLFSGKIDTTLYDADCRFTDPTLSFKGLANFVKNIAAIRPLIDTFVGDNLVTLYSLDVLPEDKAVQAKWRMEASLKNLPWRPVLDVQGTTQYSYSPTTGKIVDYKESWTENPQVALLKLLRPAAARQDAIASKRRAAARPALLYPALIAAPAADKEALRSLEMHDTDLAALRDSPPPALYPSSQWRLAFTSSEGLSSGRLGPLRGRVTQEFAPAVPGSGEGQEVAFVNRVSFAGGLVEFALFARAKAAPSTRQQQSGSQAAPLPRVDVEFIETRTRLLGVELGRAPSAGKGYWQVVFETPSVRVFTTNAGSVFVLERLPPR